VARLGLVARKFAFISMMQAVILSSELRHRELRLHLTFRLDSAKPWRVAFNSSVNAIKRKWVGFSIFT